jgi:hypothetical protein
MCITHKYECLEVSYGGLGLRPLLEWKSLFQWKPSEGLSTTVQADVIV